MRRKNFHGKCDMEVTLEPTDELAGLRIGLLGGSFNPAHDGHLQMSLFALQRLKLDAVWWLVAPCNPLKNPKEMLDFQKRVALARALTKAYEDIFVTDIEDKLQTRYAIDTLRAIKRRWPKANFVWLMGEDNLLSFDRWHAWEDIMRELPIAVFSRSGYSDSCERGKAAATFADAELPLAAVENLAVAKPPAWAVLDNPLILLSASQIRGQRRPT